MKNCISQFGLTRLNFPKKMQGGFTMIELIVTIAIFTMLTSVVLAKYRTFSTNAKFVNASEDIVLALRQAQVYGVGSKGNTTGCGTSTSFMCSYGVYFTMNNPNGITFFVDNNNNRKYDTGEVVELISWGSAVSLTSLQCGTTPCNGEMDITFNRPNPDAFITDVLGESNRVDKGVIVLTDNETSRTATITITSAGQISIQ